MKNILTIAKKELIDTLRDRRTLIFMVVLPVLVFPLILNGITRLQSSIGESAKKKTIKVGFSSRGEAEGLKYILDTTSNIEMVELEYFSNLLAAREGLGPLINNDSLAAILYVTPGFDQKVDGRGQGMVTIIHNATEESPKDRMEDLLENYQEQLLASRLDSLALNADAIAPLKIETNLGNIAPKQEILGKVAGGILPYLFVAFCFLGCMYPAIDLFTGEKERGTIETILTVPVSRGQLLIGKMAVVALSGLISATLAIGGLFLGLATLDIPPEFLDLVYSILTPQLVLMLYLMIIPLTIFFAGVMIPLSVYAKTFKEAQSIITPLNIIMVLPVVIGFLPGVELTAVTAVIPIVNIVLSTKEIIAGTMDPFLMFLVMGSLIAYAGIAVSLAFRQFGKESNILRA